MNLQRKHIDTGLKKGLLLGGVMVILHLLNHLIAPQDYMNTTFRVSSLIIWWGLIVYTLWEERKMVATFHTKEGLLIALVMMVGSSVIEFAYHYLMFHVIDPDLLDQLKTRAVDEFNGLKKMGMDIDEAEIINSIDQLYSPSGLIKSVFTGIVIYLLPALGLGYAFRKNTQEQDSHKGSPPTIVK